MGGSAGTGGSGTLPFHRLLADDGAPADWFGYSVALSGDTAFVGVHRDDDSGDSSGSAYVFIRTGSTWTQQQKLLPDDSAADDSFGYSVALSGDTALVGARYDDDHGHASGSTYVFTRTGSTWTEQQKLLPDDGAADDSFGSSISLNGDTALVGAANDDDNGSSSGSAYVFTRTGSTWTEQQKLLPDDGTAGDSFGYSVALSGDTALVGAGNDDDSGSNSGSAYVFTRTDSSWTEQQKLLPDYAAARWFGYSVALNRDIALVGAYGDDANGSWEDGTGHVGAAYVIDGMFP
jgi:hypothetical protein